MKELEMLMTALAQQPVVMVQKPDNGLRQQVWASTYLYFLNNPAYGSAWAKSEADKALAHFDKLFTQKTVL